MGTMLSLHKDMTGPHYETEASFKDVNDGRMNKYLIESFYTRTCIEGLPKAAYLVAPLYRNPSSVYMVRCVNEKSQIDP
jgi:hypothetical protein